CRARAVPGECRADRTAPGDQRAEHRSQHRRPRDLRRYGAGMPRNEGTDAHGPRRGRVSSMRLVAAEEMRALDQATIAHGTAGHVLMERAGVGATQALARLLPFVRKRGRRALVVAGKGNNGGDGFVMARALRRRGVRTEVVL